MHSIPWIDIKDGKLKNKEMKEYAIKQFIID